MFDEEPDGDPHGKCAAEIHRLQELALTADAELASLRAEVEGLRAEKVALQALLHDWMAASDAPGGWIRELRKDADRYRWMTEHRLGWFSRMAPLPWQKQTMKDALDAAIDAARTPTETRP